MENNLPSLSVIVTRYGESDDLVKSCLDSLSKQQGVSMSVFFLDQKGSEIIQQYCNTLSQENTTFFYRNIPAKSLSYARNFGARESKDNLVAFCDADCILQENWAREIVKTFTKTGASIVGTKIVPLWESKPQWYHASKIIREFYSTIDLSTQRIEIRKVVGASFALDKSKIREPLLFDEHLGRSKGKLLGGEETDLCSRVMAKGGKIFYTPYTLANHIIGKERIRFSWILKRAYFGGLSRALRGGKVESFNTQKKLIDCIAIILILPSYLLGLIKGKLRK